MTRILLSVRHKDAGREAGRIASNLRGLPEVTSVTVLSAEAEASISDDDILICVIGPNWHSALEDEADPVRRQLAEALSSEASIYIAFAGGADLPSERLLPDELSGLKTKPQFHMTRASFAADMDRMFDAIFGEGRARAEVTSDIGPEWSRFGRGLLGGLLGGALLAVLAISVRLLAGLSVVDLLWGSKALAALVMIAFPALGVWLSLWLSTRR